MEAPTDTPAEDLDVDSPDAAEPQGNDAAEGLLAPRHRVALLAMTVLTPTLLVLDAMSGRTVAYCDKGLWVTGVIVLLFLLSEPLVFHVEARNEAVSFSPTDLPLALGLFMLSPLTLIGARLLGSGLGLVIWRRQPLFKFTLNLSTFAAETLIATLVFRSMFHSIERASAGLWLGTIAALLVGLLCGGIVIAVAISCFEGDAVARVQKELSHFYLFYLPGAVLGASFAVPVLVEPWLVPLFLTPFPLVWLIMRSHGSLIHRYSDLTNVHEFSSQVGGASHLEEIADTAVHEIATHLRAEAVALVVWDQGMGTLRASNGDEYLSEALPGGADEIPWDLADASSEPFIMSAGEFDPVGEWLGGLGVDNALIVVLQDEVAPIGLLIATGRKGVIDEFEEDDRLRLKPISDQLAMALRKSQLHVQIQHDATHDRLTGLPNRAYFEALLEQTVAAEDTPQTALLLIDLDRFKEVNDTLGHQAGDLLLVKVAERLSECLSTDDFPARFGGDEYAVIAAGAGADEAAVLAERISLRLEEPFELGESQVAIAASIGVAVAPDHGHDVTGLMRRADLAMYDAKKRHARCTIYSPGLEGQDSVRLAMLGDFRKALETEELDVHFQPKIDVATGRVLGVEALARWEHPVHGLVGPDVFIPLAEQAGLIEDLTELVLRSSLRHVRRWAEAGMDLCVGVNLSPASLMNEDLPRRVAEYLEAAGVPGENLILEITEQTVIGDVPRTVRILEQLHDLGVKLSIDDFGTGYSSLTNLRTLPISELKIDRSFVIDMLVSTHDEVIVKSTIDLGHNLGYRVVAEGVETVDVLERLGELGCDIAQGFGLCRPLPVDKLDRWLAAADTQPIGDPWSGFGALLRGPTTDYIDVTG